MAKEWGQLTRTGSIFPARMAEMNLGYLDTNAEGGVMQKWRL
jgi:hypothetical protein